MLDGVDREKRRLHSGSVVECLTRDRGIAGLSLTSVGARHINAFLELVQPRKTRPDITEENVDWDVQNQIKKEK